MLALGLRALLSTLLVGLTTVVAIERLESFKLRRLDQAEKGRMERAKDSEAFALDAWFLAVRAETMAPLHLGQWQGLRTSGGIDWRSR